MSCPQDHHYSKEILMPEKGCSLESDYKQCNINKSIQACCPTGTHYVSQQQCAIKSAGSPLVGTQFICKYDEPHMNPVSQLNCCSGEIPTSGPVGYCKPQWCPGTPKCDSFMAEQCVGDKLNSKQCISYCQKNPGKCDTELTKYCANPVNYGLEICGCALPFDQYFFNTLKIEKGVTIPTACDIRCNQPNAIRLDEQQNCDIDAICVLDINSAQKETLKQEFGDAKITINQNCGSGPHPTIPTNNKKWYLFGIIIIVIIIIIIIIVIVYHNSHKSE